MIGVIADIHGNLPALKSVLEYMGDVDLIICAGDLVGYNPYPNEVIQEIKMRKIKCIRGNHDRAVIYNRYDDFNPYAEFAARWTRKNLTGANMNFLISLEDSMIIEYQNWCIAVHHGAPFDEDFYIFPEDVSEDLLKYDNADILILGHTHVPFIKKYEERVIINPGSVGQPRDGDPRASYALIDLENKLYEIKRVDYDIDLVYREIKKNNLPFILGERLYYGF